jgi:hypothetical protein
MDLIRDVKVAGVDEKTDSIPNRRGPPTEWLMRFLNEYSGKHGGDTEAPPVGSDAERVAAAVFTMKEDESVRVLGSIVRDYHQDYTFDRAQMYRLTEIFEGNEACGMEYGKWAGQHTMPVDQ